MNRREFTKSLAAVAAIPALPGKAMVAPAAAVRPHLVGWGALLARTHGQCSPQMLARLMHMELGTAQQVVRRLVADGIVGPANALGMSRAMSPLGPNLATGTGTLAPANEVLKPKLTGLDGADKILAEEPEFDEDIEEAQK